MPRILTSNTQIRNAISQLMEPGARRVAIVAFVGAGATAYIPKPRDATIVCWPKVGGTTPSAVRDFMKRGAKMMFADRVHMKVYWAKGRGAVIGSANLSTNALGAGDLRELAVRLPDTDVDIDVLLDSVAPRKVTAQELSKLQVEHEKIEWKTSAHSYTSQKTFLAWLAQPKRTPWKLGWWDDNGDFSREAKQEAKALCAKPRDSIRGFKGEYTEGDWVLMVKVGKNSVGKPKWLYVNFVVKFATSAKSDQAYEAVQTFTPKQCPAPPFRLDKEFSVAWKAACSQFTLTKIRGHESVKPPKALLQLVCEHMT